MRRVAGPGARTGAGKAENAAEAADVGNHEATIGSVSVSNLTLRITPAMAAGLSDHVWSLEEIVLLTN